MYLLQRPRPTPSPQKNICEVPPSPWFNVEVIVDPWLVKPTMREESLTMHMVSLICVKKLGLCRGINECSVLTITIITTSTTAGKVQFTFGYFRVRTGQISIQGCWPKIHTKQIKPPFYFKAGVHKKLLARHHSLWRG